MIKLATMSVSAIVSPSQVTGDAGRLVVMAEARFNIDLAWARLNLVVIRRERTARKSAEREPSQYTNTRTVACRASFTTSLNFRSLAFDSFSFAATIRNDSRKLRR